MAPAITGFQAAKYDNAQGLNGAGTEQKHSAKKKITYS